MAPLSEGQINQILRYVMLIQLGVVGTMLSFFLTDYQDFVKRDEIVIVSPYSKDAAEIRAFMVNSSLTMHEVRTALEQLNERMSKEIREADVRISRLEVR